MSGQVGRRAAGELEAAVLAVLRDAGSPLSAADVRTGQLARMLDAEPDREGVLARFVSGLSGADEELLRRALGDSRASVTSRRDRKQPGMGGEPG